MGEEYYITLTNAICCTFKQLAAMPLSTKRISLHLLIKLQGNIRKKYPSDLECQAASISERTSDAPGGE